MRLDVKGAVKRVYLIALAVVIVVAAVSASAYYYLTRPPAPVSVAPIKVGYVGDAASAGTRPCIDSFKMAADEINAQGGILGRPVEAVVGNGRGVTETSVEEARRLIMEEGVKLLLVEGRSEIALAVMDVSAELYPTYPHILIVNWAMAYEIAAKIYDDPEHYGHCFQGGPNELHYAMSVPRIFSILFHGLNRTKIAILFEGLDWTKVWRPAALGGSKVPGYEWVPDFVEGFKSYNIEVVYAKAISPKEPNYYPILEAIKNAGAQLILVISSWFTNTETFVSQWVGSAAKDLDVYLWAGLNTQEAFWTATLYKCLGVMTGFLEPTPEMVPAGWPREQWFEYYNKSKRLGVPITGNGILAYYHLFQFKKAVEKVGGLENMTAVIKALEDTEIPTALGKFAFIKEKVRYFWHTSAAVNLTDLSQIAYGWTTPTYAQWQYDTVKKTWKVVYLTDTYNYPWYSKEANYVVRADLYKTPAQIRHEAGWPGY
jgi:ABC-type branched-subunit amino acid transport system substrate-binding protein